MLPVCIIYSFISSTVARRHVLPRLPVVFDQSAGFFGRVRRNAAQPAAATDTLREASESIQNALRVAAAFRTIDVEILDEHCTHQVRQIPHQSPSKLPGRRDAALISHQSQLPGRRTTINRPVNRMGMGAIMMTSRRSETAWPKTWRRHFAFCK